MKTEDYGISLCIDCYIKGVHKGKNLFANQLYISIPDDNEPHFCAPKGYASWIECGACDTSLGGDRFDATLTLKV